MQTFVRSAQRTSKWFIGFFLLVFFVGMSGESWGQATENFSNIPTTSTGSYLTRSWTGTDNVTWTALLARTDQTINGKAICLGSSSDGNPRSVTSPQYSGGMGVLTFNYVRAFTGSSARTLQVYVNGTKIGSDVTVSTTSDVVSSYNSTINVSGTVQLEIRSTGTSQVKIDDISWTAYTGTTPSLSASQTSLTNLTYVYNAGPSASQSFTISASNLTGTPSSVTATAPTNFQVSADNSTWGNTASLPYTGTGTFPSGTGNTFYVRLASGLPVNTYTGSSVSIAGGGASASVAVSGAVTTAAPPTITPASGATVDAPFDVTFTDNADWRTNINKITVNGTQLTGGYSISNSGKITFTPSASVPANLLQASGTKTIVISAPNYTDATVSQPVGFGVATKLVMGTQPTAPTSNGAPLAVQPVVNIGDQYGNTVTSSTATVTAAVGSGTWTLGGTTTLAANAGIAAYSGLTASSTAAVTGATITFTSAGLAPATSNPFNIPAPSPTLTANPTTLTFGNVGVSANSASQSVSLSGVNLTGTGNITLTASTNFQVSADNSAFGSTALIPYTSPSLSATFWVRFNPQSAGSKTGTITGSGGGVSTTTLVTSLTGTGINPTTVTSATVPTVTYGSALSYTIVTTGGTPTSYGVVSGSTLPAGLTLDNATGKITGTPTVVVTNYQVVVSATNAANTSTGTLTFNINLKPISYTGLSATSRVYDGTTIAPLTGTAVLNSSSIVSGDNVTLTGTATGSYATSSATGIKAVTISGLSLTGSDASKYTLTQPSINGAVTVKPLTITGVTANDKVYDGLIGTTLSGTPVLNGIVGSDDVSVISGSSSAKFADPNVGSNKPVIVTGYSLTGTAAGNYTVTNGQPTGLTANITKANQTITFPALPSKTTADGDFDPGATASSGLSITYTSSNTTVATIVSGQIHIVGTGTSVITASQTGNTNYNAATNVTQTLTVTQGVFETFNYNGANPKQGYAGGDAALRSGTWYFDNALIGINSGDQSVTGTSARLQNQGTVPGVIGSIYMKFDITNGAKEVSVYNASFGTDQPSTWDMQASTDGGGTWTTIGTTTSTSTLTKVTFSGLNFNGNVRFKMIITGGVSGRRLNLDDFDYLAQNVGIPIFSLGTTSSRCQAAETVTYTATATNTTGITYTLDATSIAAGNTINASTGAVTYVSTWNGTSTITASAPGANGPTTATHTATTRTLPTATITASSTSVCASDPSPAVITFTGANGVAPYTFYYTINGGPEQSVASAGTSSTVTINVSATAGSYTYALTRISGTYCNQAQTGSVQVTVKESPVAYSITGGGSYCDGGDGVEIKLANSQTGVTYKLYLGSTLEATVAGTGGIISFGLQTAGGTYNATGTNNTTNCVTNMLGSATISINPTPTIYTVSGGGSYCAGGSGVSINLSGSQTGINYLLKNSANVTVQTLAGTGSALIFTGVTAADTYTIRTNGSCVAFMNGSAIVTINPLPIQYSVTGGGTSCSGTPVAIGLSGSQTGVNYQLFLGANPVGSVVAGTGSAISFTAQSTAGTYTVTATNATTGCPQNMTGSVGIATGTTPTATVAPATSSTGCADFGLGITFSGTSGSTITYNIRGAQVSNGLTVPIPTGFTSTTINTGTNPGAYTYTITGVTLGNCSSVPTGAGSTTTVTVNALPDAGTISGNTTSVGVGKNIKLSESIAGGTWSITNAKATINSTTANPVTVHGVAVGTDTVYYSITNAGCSNSTMQVINIYDASNFLYVTKADGNFTSPATWKLSSDNGTTFTDATDAPNDSDNIQIKHNVILDTNYNGVATASLLINSRFNGTDSVRGTLTILPNHYLSSAGAVNFNNRHVTVKSDATGSGAIGKITNGTIAGADSVTVERYTQKKRAWRLITSPLTNATINAGWQEGNVWNGATPLTSTGYGTLITGYGQGTATNANSHGYDFWAAVANTTSSIRYYVPGPTGGSWGNSLPTISGVKIRDYPAYMLFVRGDRSVSAINDTSATNLRATGTLQQGTATIGVIHGGYSTEVAGNPYASAIDFASVYSQNSSRIQNKFVVWVTKLGTYGAYTYVTSNNDGTYTATPTNLNGTPGTPLSPASDRYIQSGEGFLVYPFSSTATGDIKVDETAKAPTQQATAVTNTFRLSPDTDRKLYVNLNQKTSDTSANLTDGFMVRFDPTYTNDINDDDAGKPANFNENFGIMSHNTDLIVEARADVQKTDTVQVHMWNVTKRDYQLQVKGDNWTSAPGVHAYLVDNYLATKQEVTLSGTVTSVNFTVNTDSASWKSDRFSIVFQNDATVLPVTLTSVKAAAQNGGVNVTWTVTNEQNIKTYTVERSINGGNSYTAIGSQQAKNHTAAAITNYQSFDAAPQMGSNLYRIRIETKEGVVTYSSVVTVVIGQDNGKILITLYPNPVRPNGKVSLQMSNLATGTYLVNVYSQAGQTVYQKKITISQPNTTQSEELRLGGSIAQGSYEVRLTNSKSEVIYADKLIVGR